jgi:hypothetical protein
VSKGLLFTCGAAVFTITVLATLLYGYHVFRRMYAVTLANTGERPVLYVKPELSESVESA